MPHNDILDEHAAVACVVGVAGMGRQTPLAAATNSKQQAASKIASA
jgi:hypothetical protein